MSQHQTKLDVNEQVSVHFNVGTEDEGNGFVGVLWRGFGNVPTDAPEHVDTLPNVIFPFLMHDIDAWKARRVASR